MERLPCDLDAVVVRPLTDPAEELEWDRLVVEHHYLKSAKMMGERIRYVAEVRGVWLALLSWSGAALKLTCRDTTIGWSDVQKRQRLHLIANNTRFVILPTGRTPNMASRVLSLCTRRLSADWQEKYGHPILAAETFVEEQRFSGVCYRAAGWQELGLTAGYRRDREHHYARHGVKKRFLFRELCPAAIAKLSGPVLPDDRPITRYQIARLPITEVLFTIIAKHVADPRDPRGRRYPLGSLLAVVLVGLICGCQHIEEIESWTDSLNDHERGRLRLPWNRNMTQRTAPDAETLRNVLRDIAPEALPQAAQEWMQSIGINTTNTIIAIDGKTLRGSTNVPKDGPVKVVTAYAPDQSAILTHRVVLAHTTEVPEGRIMLDTLDLTGSLCTFDAAHTTPETAAVVRKKGATSSWSSKVTSPPCATASKPPSPPVPATAPTVRMITATDAMKSAVLTV